MSDTVGILLEGIVEKDRASGHIVLQTRDGRVDLTKLLLDHEETTIRIHLLTSDDLARLKLPR